MKSLTEIRNFEMEVDNFAASFVGSRGDPPERGTFHVVNLAKRSVRKRVFSNVVRSHKNHPFHDSSNDERTDRARRWGM